jgi:hypothetical protein
MRELGGGNGMKTAVRMSLQTWRRANVMIGVTAAAAAAAASTPLHLNVANAPNETLIFDPASHIANRGGFRTGQK